MHDEIPGFERGEELGRGGFGVVHRAWQPALRRDVALKILTADATDPEVRARFERECQAIGAISAHPHVVTVYGSGISEAGHPYLVMEYLPGGTLAQRGRVPWESAVDVGVRISTALAAAHRHGIIHRDVKPQNVLFSEFDTPMLADFGISSMIDGFETRSGSVSASIAHAAPEVLDGRPASPQSDVYGLASTIVGAILGHPPYHRDSDGVAALVARIATAPVPDLRDHGVPGAVCLVLERALAKQAADRHPDAVTFGTELAAAAGIDGGMPLTGAVPAVTGSTPAVVADGPAHHNLSAVHELPIADAATEGEDGSPTDGDAAPTRTGARRRLAVAVAACVALLAGGLVAVLAGDDDGDGEQIEVADQPTSSRRSTTTRPRSTSTAPDTAPPSDVPVDVAVQSETTIAGAVDPNAPVSGGGGAAVVTGGSGSTGSAGSSTRRTTGSSGSTGSTGGTGSTSTGGTGTTGGTGGTSGTTPATNTPTHADPAPVTTAAPVVTSPVTTAAPDLSPVLPATEVFKITAPINNPTPIAIIPAGDRRLSNGWSDPGANASSWLCLELKPATFDWWLEGANCDGSDLRVNATSPGTRVLTIRAFRECSPACSPVYSKTTRTLEITFV